ncbi:MAG: hypothetical protein RLZ98_19 [Pseudomonadota bacterium]|jgi:hypothetical protein
MNEPGRPTPATASKEDKIKDFILSTLAATAQVDDASVPELLLVAKSPDSPVARAVAAVAAGSGAAFGLQIVFVVSAAAEAAAIGEADVSMYADTVGVIDASRFMDVHEQLVLGPATVWFGDSMRREPAKRDAFESFHRDNATASRNARRSFARLWSHCTPLAVSRGSKPALADNQLVGMAAQYESNQADPAAASQKPN